MYKDGIGMLDLGFACRDATSDLPVLDSCGDPSQMKNGEEQNATDYINIEVLSTAHGGEPCRQDAQ